MNGSQHHHLENTFWNAWCPFRFLLVFYIFWLFLYLFDSSMSILFHPYSFNFKYFMFHELLQRVEFRADCIQWTEFRIFVSRHLDSGLMNIQKPWLEFDKAKSNIRQRIFEYSTSITRFSIDIFKVGPASRLSPHDHHWPKRSLFLINESTLKFIEIKGNPSSFYVIDCYRRHYHIQINKIIKITHKIRIFVASRQSLKICVSSSLDQIH